MTKMSQAAFNSNGKTKLDCLRRHKYKYYELNACDLIHMKELKLTQHTNVCPVTIHSTYLHT